MHYLLPKGRWFIEFRRKILLKFVYFLALELWILVLCNKIVLNSELEARFSLTRAFQWKVKVIPEWVDIALMRHVRAQSGLGRQIKPIDEKETNNVFHIGFLAQISPRKGLPDLIFALKAIALKQPKRRFKLFIGGLF